VADLNGALSAGGFQPDVGSRFGSKTRHAVYAFQKHHGMATSGTFSAFMWGLLEEPVRLEWRPEPDRIEIDLAKQVLYIVEARSVVMVLPISSGNGASYRTESGNEARATTPEGLYRFQRRIAGMREAFLGQMYNPYYFVRGYAIRPRFAHGLSLYETTFRIAVVAIGFGPQFLWRNRCQQYARRRPRSRPFSRGS